MGCDRWLVNSLERPFTENAEIYVEGADILSASFGQDEDWLYGKITTFWVSPPDDIHFAIEVDTDMDTRGNILFVGLVPNSTDWTTDSVQVWADLNKDVGGRIPVEGENKPAGDGYETLIFNAGKGNDADLAWIRNSPNAANDVEIAFKATLLDAEPLFQWMMWTIGGNVNPAEFDLVDFY